MARYSCPPEPEHVQFVVIIKSPAKGIKATLLNYCTLCGAGDLASPMFGRPKKSPADIEREHKIAAILGNDRKRIKDKKDRQLATDIVDTEHSDNSILIIYSNCSWRATVGSNSVYQTVEGKGYKTIEVTTAPGSIYSHNAQKLDRSGFLNIYVVYKGRILKQGSTTASYGVVSAAGKF